MLINASGLQDNERIKIYQYNVYQRNKSGEAHAGIAIAIKKNIEHKLLDHFNEDVLAVKVETSRGPLNIMTSYVPPRNLEDFPTEDINMMMGKNEQVFLVGDLNARAPFIGHRDTNFLGRILSNFVNRQIIRHLGPDFNTYLH